MNRSTIPGHIFVTCHFVYSCKFESHQYLPKYDLFSKKTLKTHCVAWRNSNLYTACCKGILWCCTAFSKTKLYRYECSIPM